MIKGRNHWWSFFMLTFKAMRIYISILVMLFHFDVFCQTILSISEAATHNLSIVHLDSLYKSALHSDTTQAVFNHQSNAFSKTYTQLVQQLGRFQNENGFNANGGLKFFHRLYFNPNGQLDYYLYQFKPNTISPEQEQRFKHNTELFFKSYTFPMQAPCPFAQCCKVVL